MRILAVLGGIALLAAASSSSPADAVGATLCSANELVVFSCSTGVKIASICASKYISNTGGNMQYRFGRAERVELAYPSPEISPRNVFMSGTMMFSGGGGAWLRFSKGQYSYTIFNAIGNWGPSGGTAEAAGVAVEKDGKEFANIPCRTSAMGEIGPDFFKKTGLKDGGIDEFEIPESFFPK